MIQSLRTAVKTPHAKELALYLSAYLVYLGLSKMFGNHDLAVENAERVITAEQSLGIFWETSWQAAAIDIGSWPVIASNLIYVVTYMPLILVMATVLFLKDRGRYYYYRRLMFISLAIALVVFAAYPMAPPMDTTGFGFVDTFREYGPASYLDSDFTFARNSIAAMPSMHFAWTLAFGIMFLTSRTRWVKIFSVLYPGITLYAIIVSGQHFFLDAAAGTGLLAITYIIHELHLRRGQIQARLANRVAMPALRRLRPNFVMSGKDAR